jgi:cobalt-zinc-cadmium resistance protein CzcA
MIMKRLIKHSLYTFTFISTCYGQNVKISSAEEAVNLAIQNNGRIKSLTLQIESQKSLQKTAYELPKLEVGTQLGQYNSIKIDNAFQLSQTIPFPTQFVAKKQLLDATTRQVELQNQLTINEIKNQVRIFYNEIEYLQHNKSKLQSLDTLYQEFIRVASLRYKTGDTKKIDISTAEVKRNEIKLLIQQNDVYLANAYQNLQTLLNTSEKIEITTKLKFEPLQLNAILDSVTIANHPLVQTYYQNSKIAEQNKKVAQSQILPDFTIGYNNQSLIGVQTINGQDQYFSAGKRFHVLNLGVAIPLPTGSKRANIQSLEYQQQANDLLAIQEQTMIETEFKNALLQHEQNLLEHEFYLNQALPNAREIINAVNLSYKTGEISYMEYLYAIQTATDVELRELELIRKINQNIININYIINK